MPLGGASMQEKADEEVREAEGQLALVQKTVEGMATVAEDALAHLALLDKELKPTWDVGDGRAEGDAPEVTSVSLSHSQAISIVCSDIGDAMKSTDGTFDALEDAMYAALKIDSTTKLLWAGHL